MNIKILSISLCIAVISLSGCALTTDRIELQYNQQAGIRGWTLIHKGVNNHE
jgi:hypothetical protein